jgi:hypothetical protein
MMRLNNALLTSSNAGPVLVKRFGTFSLMVMAAAFAAPGYWLLFTTLMAHDDEGYVLITLKNYSAHGGLYTQVFSQYGPFFYFFHDAAHRLLGYEFSNTAGRIITLGCWLVASFACGHLVWRQTKAWTLAGGTLALTFVYLRLMVNEPIHPGGMIAAMIALIAWGGAELISHRAIRGLALLTGGVGAALILTKINVGVFFILATGTWFILHLRPPAHARIISTVMAGILVILPFPLMAGQLGESWARLFAALSAVASLTILATGWRVRTPLTEWKFAGHGLATVLLVTIGVAGTIGSRGTPFLTMFEGIVLNPLRQPGIYHYPPDWKPMAAAVAVISLLLAFAHRFVPKIRIDGLLIGMRVSVALMLGLAACQWFPFSLHSSVMSYVVPLAWIFVLPLGPTGDEKETSGIGLWIGLLLVLQYLHAYPVAGSQIAWGTFLAIPLVALGLHDTQHYLISKKMPQLGYATSLGCLVLSLISVTQLSVRGWYQYNGSQPLALSGAENVRPPEEFGSALRMLTLNAAAHGDMLFSLPGMFSFNLWTQLPTPTLNNTTHWFTLLNPEQQKAIADALEHDARPVVIVHQGMLRFLAESHFVVSSPLTDFINQHFTRAFRVGEFEFWVRRGRQIMPIGTAEFLRLNSPAAGLPAHKLELVVAIPDGEKIARIELCTLSDNPVILAYWDPTGSPLSYTGLTLQGRAVTTEIEQGWLRSLPPLTRLDLPLTNSAVPDRQKSTVLVKNADGKILAEARFIE